jgi:hypothetical protein
MSKDLIDAGSGSLESVFQGNVSSGLSEAEKEE